MVACAFAELLVGCCLEVKEIQREGRSERVFKAARDIDTELLGPVEKLVIECLDAFRSLEDLIQIVESRLTVRDSSANKGVGRVSPADALLLAEAGEVIDEALEYLPPTCSCSI